MYDLLESMWVSNVRVELLLVGTRPRYRQVRKPCIEIAGCWALNVRPPSKNGTVSTVEASLSPPYPVSCPPAPSLHSIRESC